MLKKINWKQILLALIWTKFVNALNKLKDILNKLMFLFVYLYCLHLSQNKRLHFSEYYERCILSFSYFNIAKNVPKYFEVLVLKIFDLPPLRLYTKCLNLWIWIWDMLEFRTAKSQEPNSNRMTSEILPSCLNCLFRRFCVWVWHPFLQWKWGDLQWKWEYSRESRAIIV